MLTCLLLPHLRGKGWRDWGHVSPAQCSNSSVSPERKRSTEEPGWLLLGDPWTDRTTSLLGFPRRLPEAPLQERKVFVCLTQRESEAKGAAAASRSQAEILSNELADPWENEGLDTDTHRTRSGQVGEAEALLQVSKAPSAALAGVAQWTECQPVN